VEKPALRPSFKPVVPSCWQTQMNFATLWHCVLFTTWRYASATYAVVLCLSLSVTSRYCTKVAKRRIMQINMHNFPGTLVFPCQRFWWYSNWVTHNGDDQHRWGSLLKSAVFTNILLISEMVRS